MRGPSVVDFPFRRSKPLVTLTLREREQNEGERENRSAASLSLNRSAIVRSECKAVVQEWFVFGIFPESECTAERDVNAHIAILPQSTKE